MGGIGGSGGGGLGSIGSLFSGLFGGGGGASPFDVGAAPFGGLDPFSAMFGAMGDLSGLGGMLGSIDPSMTAAVSGGQSTTDGQQQDGQQQDGQSQQPSGGQAQQPSVQGMESLLPSWLTGNQPQGLGGFASGAPNVGQGLPGGGGQNLQTNVGDLSQTMSAGPGQPGFGPQNVSAAAAPTDLGGTSRPDVAPPATSGMFTGAPATAAVPYQGAGQALQPTSSAAIAPLLGQDASGTFPPSPLQAADRSDPGDINNPANVVQPWPKDWPQPTPSTGNLPPQGAGDNPPPGPQPGSEGQRVAPVTNTNPTPQNLKPGDTFKDREGRTVTFKGGDPFNMGNYSVAGGGGLRLSPQLSRIMQNPQMRQQLQNLLQQFARRFSPQQIAQFLRQRGVPQGDINQIMSMIGAGNQQAPARAPARAPSNDYPDEFQYPDNTPQPPAPEQPAPPAPRTPPAPESPFPVPGVGPSESYGVPGLPQPGIGGGTGQSPIAPSSPENQVPPGITDTRPQFANFSPTQQNALAQSRAGARRLTGQITARREQQPTARPPGRAQQILAQIRQRESGNNYRLRPEQNYAYPRSHASGAYQIQPGTWQQWTRESGIGRQYREAYLAPPQVQDAVALWALQHHGTGPWRASAPRGGYPALAG